MVDKPSDIPAIHRVDGIVVVIFTILVQIEKVAEVGLMVFDAALQRFSPRDDLSQVSFDELSFAKILRAT